MASSGVGSSNWTLNVPNIYRNSFVGIGSLSNPISNLHINSSINHSKIRFTNDLTGHTIADGLEIGLHINGPFPFLNYEPYILNKENKTLKLGSNNTDILALKPNGDGEFLRNLILKNNFVLEFGNGIAGKEENAGKIGYQTYTFDALDIVGAGNDFSTRKIKFWNEGGATFAGTIIGEGSATFAGPIRRNSTGTANIVPIAYGVINPDGTIASGTGNFTVTRASTGVYQIAITGVSNYTDIVCTTNYGNTYNFSSTHVNNDIGTYIHITQQHMDVGFCGSPIPVPCLTNYPHDIRFSFVAYKP